MGYRSFAIMGLLMVWSASLPGQTKTGNWKAPRAADGHPDLQGIWTNATLTPMERPAAFAGKATLTEEEAAAFEKHSSEELKSVDGQSNHPLLAAAGSSGVGGYNVLFIDRGAELARVDGVKRTSLIVDPPDGKAPQVSIEGKRRKAALFTSFMNYDSVKNRPLSERCLLGFGCLGGFGTTAGPPMLPVLYNNNYQIVQTADHVMILVEMVHDARIIRINGTHAPSSVRQYLGDSIGHWEGDTLVVDTTNFTNQTPFDGSSENLHVIERFQRVDANTILYRATIDDPSTFARQFTMEFPFVAAKGPIYEYACHEGNYAMTDILGGARNADKAKDKH
jgi:hypothetical protein